MKPPFKKIGFISPMKIKRRRQTCELSVKEKKSGVKVRWVKPSCARYARTSEFALARAATAMLRSVNARRSLQRQRLIESNDKNMTLLAVADVVALLVVFAFLAVEVVVVGDGNRVA